ncbi:hypothetical protein BCR36DRAFT_411527 [Piromyces finnis]|uniref:Phospholipid/glycerol acyltransferase domain-containing protein n=1 Tax=Piromyces finnis TaxID=1754191 RepID=A0A1Y1VCQ0_9FUNG|nr:hypothetical protein BCR36DRAFT_411527 [Piromyces finnis]|eukprot:ORX52074.1 hypothetical protein BCR36DRAFT_411527 [Piromyces finnis]
MGNVVAIIIAIYLITFIFLNYAYYILKKYYKHIKYKDNETGNEVDIQYKFAPLVPIDHLHYIEFVGIGTLLFPIRLPFVLLSYFLLKLNLKLLKLIYKNHEKNQLHRKKFEKATHFWLGIYFFINNISIEKRTIPFEKIYKKYLGEDYDFSQEDFSLYISNHLGYLEIAAYMKEYGVSYLITYELVRAPAVGAALKELGSFFVNRESKESREDVLETLKKRQQEFYNKKSFIRTLVFPEGTTTNGKYLASFKRGTFISLLPLKPLIVLPYDEFPCSTNRFYFFIRTICTFSIKIPYAELPIIKPTPFLFEKYKMLGKEQWEIYANVVNKIYAEIGGFKETNIKFRDRVMYYQIAEDGFYKSK